MATQTPPINPLSAPSLAHYMLASIPPTSSPQLNNAFDAIALAAHATFLAVGFRLIGLGEDDRIEASSDASQPQPLPAAWNATSGSYSFRYAHSQSSMQFLLKITRMANKAVVMGMGVGDDRTCSCDFATGDYVSNGNLPSTPLAQQSANDEECDDPTHEAKRTLTDVFISAGRLSDFGSMMRVRVIQKLIPSLNKEGYEESTSETATSSQQQPPHPRQPRQPLPELDPPQHDPLRDERDPPARPHPLHDPLAQPPPRRGPLPEPIPGFEDEYEALRPLRGGMMPGGGMGMPRYGERDLYPQGLGPRDPLYGGVGPGLGPMGGGGGMHPTFDDPLFAGQGRRGQGYDPQAPPGSRYDPVGPGGARHPRGAGTGGRPPNPFGGFGDGDFI